MSLKSIFLYTLFTPPSKPLPHAPQRRSPPTDVNTSSFTLTLLYYLYLHSHVIRESAPILTRRPGPPFCLPFCVVAGDEEVNDGNNKLGERASYQVC